MLLNRNYNLYNAKDMRDLMKEAPPIMLAILAAVNEHNNISAKIGYKISPNNEWDRESRDSPSVQLKIADKKVIRSKILTACKAINYTYDTEVDGRIKTLKPRGGEKRSIGDIKHINSKALFILSSDEAIQDLERLLVSTIIEGN